MASPPQVSPKLRFGAFQLDVAAGKLFKARIPIKLQPQPLRVLLLLVMRRGQVLPREEIQRCLWGESTFVDFEHGINFSINQIRAALCDDPGKPHYIETLPRVGYRFIAPVTTDELQDPSATAAEELGSSRHEWVADPGSSGTVSPGTRSEVAAVSGSLISVAQRKRFYGVLILITVLSVLAVVGYVALRYQSRSKVPNLQNIQITKLTDSGTAEDMAISSDGRYLVYTLRDGEKERLWLRQVATGSDVEILPPDTNGFHGLTFSPDGNYVYFVRSDKNDPFFKYLYAMPLLGGSPRKLITDVDSPVSFSPDGHQFIYEHCIPARDEIELKIADTGKAGDRLLSTLPNANCSLFQPGPNWSQDGRTIVVPVSHSGRQQRWVLDAVSVSNGRVRQLYSSVYDIGRPVWLAGGEALMMPHYDPGSGREQLWTISFPRGEARRLTNDLSEYGTDLDITRDGGTIASITRTTISNVWEASAAHPSGARQITSGNLPMTDIAYAADGKVLSASADSKLWIMNSDGSERTLLADNAGWLTPCGRFVVFASYRGDRVTLERINADGSHATQVVSGDVWKPLKTSMSTRAPACSPDGKFVFYVNAGRPQKICRAPVEGGPPVEIAETLGDSIAGRLSISPDGKLIAYIYDQFNATTTPGWKLAVIPLGRRAGEDN